MKKEGYDSEIDGVPELPVFRGDGKYFKITEEDYIIIFEYDDYDLLYEDQASINDDGYSVKIESKNEQGSYSGYSWLKPPHFYVDSNLLIQYIGDNKSIIDFLDENCENKIAGM